MQAFGYLREERKRQIDAGESRDDRVAADTIRDDVVLVSHRYVDYPIAEAEAARG